MPLRSCGPALRTPVATAPHYWLQSERETDSSSPYEWPLGTASHGERADRAALALQHLEFADALLERTAGQLHTQSVPLKAAPPVSRKPFEQLSLPWLWQPMQ